MSSASETLPIRLVKKRLDAAVNSQAADYIIHLQELAYSATEIPEDKGKSVLENLASDGRLNQQLVEFCFYASAREQAEHSSADVIHPTDWASFALQGIRRIGGKHEAQRSVFKPQLFTEAHTDIQGQIFTEMIEARVFAEGENIDSTGREYALMAATGRVAMSAEDLGLVPGDVTH